MQSSHKLIFGVLTIWILCGVVIYFHANAFSGPSQNPPSGNGVLVASGTILAINGATTLATTTTGNFTENGTDATVTGSFGNTALTVGRCVSSSVAVAGAPTTAGVIVSPQTFPGTGVWWQGYVSVAGTVVVEVCAATTTTPTASVYNVRIIR